MEVLRARGMPAMLLITWVAFTSWSLLLPVLPLAVLDGGASPAIAGLVTGVFMASTVVMELFVPALARRVGYRPLLAAGVLLLGPPSALHALTLEPWVVLLISAVRGAGFGLLVVVAVSLVAELVGPHQIGTASGFNGAAVGVAQLIGLFSGLALAQKMGYGPVFFLAAAVGCLGVLGLMGLPQIYPAGSRHRPDGPSAKAEDEDAGGPDFGFRELVLACGTPAVAMSAVAAGFGTLSAFLPPAARALNGAVVAGMALSAVSVAVVVGRLAAGVAADQKGPGVLLGRGVLACAVGVTTIAVVLLLPAHPAWLLLGALVFGLGYGITQNDSLTLMFARSPADKVSSVSVTWNMAYDGGTGIGSVVFGAVAAATVATQGYGAVFAAAATSLFVLWLLVVVGPRAHRLRSVAVRLRTRRGEDA